MGLTSRLYGFPLPGVEINHQQICYNFTPQSLICSTDQFTVIYVRILPLLSSILVYCYRGCSVTELDTRSSTPLHLMNANTDIKAIKAVVKKLNRLSELKVLNEMNEEKMRVGIVNSSFVHNSGDI